MKYKFLALFMLLGFGALAQFPNNPCAGPSQRVALVNLQKGAVVEGWRAGQIGLTDTCGNQFYQQYVEVNLTPIGYTPTATGNTANLSEFVITPAAEIWYIDWQGNAINLSGGGGCDEDFLQISDNSCPDALTDSIYKYKYVSIGARGVWPVAELLVSDSVGVGMAVISGNRNGRVAIHDNLNDNWSVYDQGGSTTNLYVQDQGLFRVATATGSPQNAALLEEHFGVSTLDSTIIFYQYPNSRVDTQTAINFLYTDNLGIVRSKLLSQILGDSATVYNLSTINPLPTQYQKSTSFVRKNLNTATPIPQRGMWISNGSEWLWLGFVLDTSQVVTPFIANQNVTYPKIQNVTASRLLGNPTGAAGTVQEIKIGTNLYFSNDTLHANAGGAGQVLTAGDGSGDNKTLDLSGGGGTVTLDPSGIFTLSRTGNTLTMSAVEVDGSTSNEIQGITAGDGSGDNKTLDLSLGGGTVTLDPAGIFTLSRTGNTLTMSAVEVDGSVTNEGVLGVGAGGGNDALLLSNTSGATGTTISGGTGIQITETTSANGGIITITNAAAAAQVLTAGDGTGDNKTLDLSGGGGTVTLDPSGIFTLSRTGNTLTMSAVEVDGSVTNEGVLGVGAGGSNDALLLSNTSGATGTTISGGTGIQITETTSANGGTITITNTAADRDWLTITNLFPTVFDSFIYRRKPASIGTNIFRKASDLKHTPFQVVDSTGYLGANAGVLALFSGNRRGGVAFQDNNEPDGSAFSRITQRGQICQLSFVEGGSFELMSDDGTTLDEGTQITRFTYYTADDEGGTAYWPDYGGSRSDTAQLFTVAGFGFGGKMVSKPASAVVGSSAFINGGNSFGTTTTLGTNDAQALNIETNNNTRVKIDTTGSLNIEAATSTPGNPTDGVQFFVTDEAGKNYLNWKGEDALPWKVAPDPAFSKLTLWSAQGNGSNVFVQGVSNIAYGTTTNRTTVSTNFFQSTRRIGFVTGATSPSNAGTRGNDSPYWAGDGTDQLKGYRYVCRFGLSTATTTNEQVFVGLRSSNLTITAGTTPSSITNSIYMGFDSGQTTFRIGRNDGSGTATTIDLGSSFPANTTNTDLYEVVFNVVSTSSSASTCYYQVLNLSTGAKASGSFSSDLPANTTFMNPHIYVSNGADAVAVGIDVLQYSILTAY